MNDDQTGRREIEVLDDKMAEILKRKKPSDRIAIGFGLWTSAHDMLTVHIRKTHPDWDKVQVAREVSRRFLHGAV